MDVIRYTGELTDEVREAIRNAPDEKIIFRIKAGKGKPMTDEQTTLRMTRSTIASLPNDTQEVVSRMAQQIREWLKTDGHRDERMLAFALVGAELAAEYAP